MKSIEIANVKVGCTHPVFVVAEVGQAHDGSLGQAHAYIDAIATSGAHAVKFQTHIADAESSPEETFRINFSYEDKTRYDYWRRMEFTEEQWIGLKEHANSKGLIFLSTPFSIEAVDLLRRLEVPAWKIASGEANNLPMIQEIAKDKKPIIVSTGLSGWSDIDETVSILKQLGNDFAILQCTSAYPCDAREVGFNNLAELKNRYSCPIGLSDHSGDIHSSIAAVALGADIIELHTVFSKHCFGPDTNASVTIEDLYRVVQGVSYIRDAIQHPVDKNTLANQKAHLKATFGKSLFSARNLAKGTSLKMNDVILKKPGTGIEAKKLTEYIGRILKNDIIQGQKFRPEDFD